MRFALILVFVSSAFFAAGCKQGVGDRCQVMSDCEDGLVCVLPAGGTPQAGGTCQPQGGGQDTGVTADLASSTDLATAGSD